MISGEQSQLISSEVDPNMPFGRSSLPRIRPQRRMYQGSFDSAVLAAFSDSDNMLVLPSRSLVPGPFPPSFKTGTTLPPLADPFSMSGEKAELLASHPLPLETALMGEHVVLLL